MPNRERREAPAKLPLIVANLQKDRRETLRIALDRYQGVNLIDLRVCVDLTESSGIQTPTKKGLSLRVEMLPEIIAALLEAQAQARELGLCGGPGHG